MLVAKRSILIFASGKPRAFSAAATACIMPSGPQTNTASMSVEVDPVREQRVGLRAVDAAVQELDVLRLAREHVDEVEAGRDSVSLSAASSSLNITVPDARLP